MRMYRLLMPAVTVAGALALAGCGGGSSTPGGPPAGSDPETLEFAKGGFHNAGDGRLLTCDSDDGCELTVKDRKVQETEAELTDAGFTITNRGTPPATEMEEKELTAAVKRIFDTVRDSASNTDRAQSRGTVTFTGTSFSTKGEVTATFDGDGRRAFDTNSDPIEATVKETGTASAISGWNGKKYGASDDNNVHTVAVYDNRGDPKKSAFDLDRVAAANGVPEHVAHSVFRTETITGFPSTKPRGTTHSAGAEVPGTVNGADGKFRCNASSCTSNGNTGSVLSDNWIFIPAANAMVETLDANFVRFGWWLRTQNPAENWAHMATFVEGFGTADEPAAVFGNWLGTATYKGGATGQVAISRGTGDPGNLAGEFTANATLTANFTPTSGTNAGAGGTIDGTIDGFTVNGNSQDWVVKLLASPLAADNAAFGKMEDGTTWALTKDGDPAGADGGWTGNFYNENADPVPESVAGTFAAEYDNVGAMRGAFGADEDPAN